MRLFLRNSWVVVVLFVLALGVVHAQAPVSAADITRLETSAAEIDRLVVSLRTTDPTLAGQISTTLAELKEDITYLKVKQRRETGVTREEYATVRDRLETLRTKAAGAQRVAAQPVLDEPEAKLWTVPVGTELDVRLQTPLNSATA